MDSNHRGGVKNEKGISLLIAAIMIFSLLGVGIQAASDDVLAIRGADGTDEAMRDIVSNTLEDGYLADPFDTKIPSHYDAYPMEDNPSIDIWMPIDAFLASLDGDFNNFYVYEKAMELTGINVNFISPAAGTEADNFTIMTSSIDSLPDIIVQADRYPGGLESGYLDGRISISPNTSMSGPLTMPNSAKLMRHVAVSVLLTPVKS